MQIFNFISASILGFVLFEIFSNPEKKIHNKVPKLKLRFVEFFPVRIYIKGKIIHVHHWMFLSLLLVITVFFNPIIIDSIFAKGAMFGGVAQGLTFPDWRSVVKKKHI